MPEAQQVPAAQGLWRVGVTCQDAVRRVWQHCHGRLRFDRGSVRRTQQPLQSMRDYALDSATAVATIQDDFVDAKFAHFLANILDSVIAEDITSDEWSVIIECMQAVKPANVGMQRPLIEVSRGYDSGVWESPPIRRLESGRRWR